MATELVTFKMEKEFLHEVDEIAKQENYGNRTEFIRSALREKIDEIKLKQAMLEIGKMKGKAKRKVSDEEIHSAREKAFEKLKNNLKL